MDQPLSPAAQAGALRAKAAALSGAERDYCLWLASEWDKSGARHGATSQIRHAAQEDPASATVHVAHHAQG